MPAKGLDNEGRWQVGDRVSFDVACTHKLWGQEFTVVGFYRSQHTGKVAGMLLRGQRGGRYRCSKRQYPILQLWHRERQGV